MFLLARVEAHGVEADRAAAFLFLFNRVKKELCLAGDFPLHGPGRPSPRAPGDAQVEPAAAAAAEISPRERCRFPGCRNFKAPRKTARRGLCEDCYGHYQSLVYSGSTSWKELEARGIVAPHGRRKKPLT